MFGYVRPQKFELLVREYSEYEGIYCSLCRRLGKRYGFAARLALNYDCTFYALFLISADRCIKPAFTKGKCCVNPLKKCFYCKTDEYEKIFDAACALTVILTYYKLVDDIHDSKLLKKIVFCVIYPVMALTHRKAVKNFPRLEKIVADAMVSQAEIEKSDKPAIDLCAQPTAEMLEHILELAVADNGRQDAVYRIFSYLGYNMGRWIYLIDAADDLEKDITECAFNPFIIKFSLNKSSSGEDIQTAKKYANETLNMSLSQMAEAVDLLDFNSLGPVVKNVILKGLPQMQKELLFKKEKTNVGRSV